MTGEEASIVPKFIIKLDGTELEDEITTSIENVSFEEEINLPSMFNFKVGIKDFEKGDWRLIDLDQFKLGSEVKISIGLDEPVELMTGEITTLEPTFGDYSFLTVRGYDRMHRLRFGTMSRSFLDMKESDIASSIAQEVGLTPEVEDTTTVHPYIFQNNLTNYEFLKNTTKDLGYEMMVDDKKFIFRPSKEETASSLSLEHGIDIDSFSLQLKTLTKGSEIEVRGWDVKKKELITSTAKKGSENTKMGGKETGFELSEKPFGTSALSIQDMAVIDAQDAENIGKARYNVILKDFLSGEGRCPGNPEIRSGRTMEITGIGERFSGVYYITSSVHTYDSSGYTTSFKVRRTGV